MAIISASTKTISAVTGTSPQSTRIAFCISSSSDIVMGWTDHAILDIDLFLLADEMYLPGDFLVEINTLLEAAASLFQGPPGTGKTYVAQQLAELTLGQEAGLRSCNSTRPTPMRTSFRATVPPCKRSGAPDSNCKDRLKARLRTSASRTVWRQTFHHHRRDQPWQSRQSLWRTVFLARIPGPGDQPPIHG